MYTQDHDMKRSITCIPFTSFFLAAKPRAAFVIFIAYSIFRITAFMFYA